MGAGSPAIGRINMDEDGEGRFQGFFVAYAVADLFDPAMIQR